MIIMKTIVSALLALTVLAGVAGSASAAEFFYGSDRFDARQFFDYIQNQTNGQG
jgi:hypothetical protein